ncbi:putative nuclease HARBI1 [Chionoecetes opilio]|uniref:Putative nuclease HARBI1 n=1 Tax=Chionoecetes opilio TaxID=41210 RepID=A0A8J5CYZ4_CHIOP|nr:putative nuclease HARBI1 [Chionoecetes opilio]
MEFLYVVMYDRALRRERRFRDRLDLLALSDSELINHYRFPRHELLQLIQELEPALQRKTRRGHAIPTHTQVLIALRFFASGSFQSIVGGIGGPSQGSVSRILRDVTNALSNKAVEQIKMPSTAHDLRVCAENFRRIRNFPRVVGAIDCTHVAIKGPSVDEALYMNSKRYHSINVQVVCDAANLIISYCARFPGATHDSIIWNNCALHRRFDRGDFGDYLLLGDSGYPLESFLMTPVRNHTTASEERYNWAHTRTRVIVEQTFGILKSRFRCLHKSGGVLMYKPLKCAKIVTSCLLLHNRCVTSGIPVPQQLEEDEQPDVAPVDGRADHETGRVIRDSIIQNFFD